MRSAVLRTAENVDIYVPNKTLLTSTVAAYTNMTQTTRHTLKVGVSYDSNPIEVRDALQAVVESHGLVLNEPAPAVLFVGFGSFTLDFEVAISLAEPGRAGQVLSDLHFMIYREFTKRGIEIPIPQQDFNLRTASISPIEQLLAASPDGTPTVADGNRGDAHPHENGTEHQPSTTLAAADAKKSASERPNLPG
jgi:small-conductance mechanosensitive channel